MGHQSRDRACVEIGERIVTGRLPAGTVLDEGALAVSELDEIELRETYPVALLLEGLAVRSTPGYPRDALVRMREINADMERDGDDPAGAATHDFRFHEELVRHCGNVQLLATLRPLKRRLLRYELAYM